MEFAQKTIQGYIDSIGNDEDRKVLQEGLNNWEK
jgi:hypothetical protein